MLPYPDNLINPNCWLSYVLLCTLGLINPILWAWLSLDISLAMCEPTYFPYSLWESCPAWGWQCCREVKEHTGLWLGGMLQWHSWLRGVLLHKISILVFKPLQLHLIMNYNEHDECFNVWFWFRCMVLMYACFSSNHFNFYVYVHGVGIPGR